VPVKKKKTKLKHILSRLFLGNAGNILSFCFQAKALNNTGAVVEGRKASMLDYNNFLQLEVPRTKAPYLIL